MGVETGLEKLRSLQRQQKQASQGDDMLFQVRMHLSLPATMGIRVNAAR
jgi:hypothetical protein